MRLCLEWKENIGREIYIFGFGIKEFFFDSFIILINYKVSYCLIFIYF